MTRAIERKRQQAQSEALALLQELEREDAAAGKDVLADRDADHGEAVASELGDGPWGSASGRMTFGQPGDAALQVYVL